MSYQHHRHKIDTTEHTISVAYGNHVFEFSPQHRPKDVRCWIEAVDVQGCGNDCSKDEVWAVIHQHHWELHCRITSNSALVTWEVL